LSKVGRQPFVQAELTSVTQDKLLSAVTEEDDKYTASASASSASFSSKHRVRSASMIVWDAEEFSSD
jgi:hypothetical protein